VAGVDPAIALNLQQQAAEAQAAAAASASSAEQIRRTAITHVGHVEQQASAHAKHVEQQASAHAKHVEQQAKAHVEHVEQQASAHTVSLLQQASAHSKSVEQQAAARVNSVEQQAALMVANAKAEAIQHVNSVSTRVRELEAELAALRSSEQRGRSPKPPPTPKAPTCYQISTPAASVRADSGQPTPAFGQTSQQEAEESTTERLLAALNRVESRLTALESKPSSRQEDRATVRSPSRTRGRPKTAADGGQHQGLGHPKVLGAALRPPPRAASRGVSENDASAASRALAPTPLAKGHAALRAVPEIGSLGSHLSKFPPNQPSETPPQGAQYCPLCSALRIPQAPYCYNCGGRHASSYDGKASMARHLNLHPPAAAMKSTLPGAGDDDGEEPSEEDSDFNEEGGGRGGERRG